MTEKDKTDQKPEPTTFCRRLQRMLELGDHEKCPYCFGEKADVKEGWYDRFCDFKPGQDPVNFGFPPDSSRNLES